MTPRRATWWAIAAVGMSLVGVAFGLVGMVMRRYDRGLVVVGAIEEVTLVAWGVTGPARIDTGAASSSLDARDVEQVDRDLVEFTLPDRLGGRRVRCRRAGSQAVRSSDGDVERRPVVELEIALGTRRLWTRFTLNDRSRMDYPMLIGRNTLEGRFLVDVTRGKPAPGAEKEKEKEREKEPPEAAPMAEPGDASADEEPSVP
jgi:hypothetical protein